MNLPAHDTAQRSFLSAFIDDVWNHGRYETLPLYLHDGYCQVDERSEVVVRGREAFAEHVQTMRALVEDIQVRVTHVVSAGEALAYRWELLGCVTEPAVLGPGLRVLAAHLPDLRLISLSGMNIARLTDGLIVEEVNELDPQSVTQQLGWWQ